MKHSAGWGFVARANDSRYVVSKMADWAHYKWWIFHRPFLKKLHDIKWWIKHRTTHKYNMVKMPTLKPGWYDTDTRLLHASCALLENYVERERPFTHVEWNDGDESREIANEIHSLYYWWQRHKRFVGSDATMQEEDEMYKAETANLVRLMQIRRALWT
jgi:hypothetical protein